MKKSLFIAVISAVIFVSILIFGNSRSKIQESVLILSGTSACIFGFLAKTFKNDPDLFPEKNIILAKKCGHNITITKGSIYDGDKKRGPYKIELKENTDYCFDCIKKSVIECPWCHGPIFPDEPITLYSQSKENFEIPEKSHVYKKEPLTLVGCARCADTGADYSGFWVLPGEVMRKESMIETAMKNPGKAVFNNDLTNKKSENKVI